MYQSVLFGFESAKAKNYTQGGAVSFFPSVPLLSLNHETSFCCSNGIGGEDLTAARKFQMDANGRKFENRVAAWLKL